MASVELSPRRFSRRDYCHVALEGNEQASAIRAFFASGKIVPSSGFCAGRSALLVTKRAAQGPSETSGARNRKLVFVFFSVCDQISFGARATQVHPSKKPSGPEHANRGRQKRQIRLLRDFTNKVPRKTLASAKCSRRGRYSATALRRTSSANSALMYSS